MLSFGTTVWVSSLLAFVLTLFYKDRPRFFAWSAFKDKTWFFAGVITLKPFILAKSFAYLAVVLRCVLCFYLVTDGVVQPFVIVDVSVVITDGLGLVFALGHR